MSNVTLKDEEWLECERYCRRFEAAWQETPRPALEDFLPEQPGAFRDSVLGELVHLDLEFRLRAGDDVRVEEYLRRFPQLESSPDVVLELIEEEFSLRQETDRDVSPTEYVDRFPPFAPELQRRLSGVRGARTSVQGPSRPRVAHETAPLPHIPGCEILEIIGRGGMGIVYKARQPALDRVVAIKMMRAGVRADDEERARFQTEVRAAAQLRHVNIVQIHDVGEFEGQPFCIQEYIADGTLQHLLAFGPRPPRDVAVFAAALARAVHFAHQNGIVHRDLKPGNILLQMPGKATNGNVGILQAAIPKIADFGLAKRLGDLPTHPGGARGEMADLTETGMIVGTVQYMAPEQADGKVVGPTADVYSLGAVLYEMLTGRPPLHGHSPLATLEMLRHQEPISLCRLQPTVPRELDTICLKCLEKDPARRYPSAAALADDLERFLAGEPIQAQPMSRIERGWRWCRRKPALAGLWAALILLVVGALSVAFWQQHEYTRDLTRQADARRKRELTENGVADALEHARQIRSRLHVELARATGVTQLLNDPARWSAPIETAQAALARAEALRTSADGELDEALLAQMASLTAQIARDDNDRKLALQLEKIRLDRASWIDGGFDLESALRDYPLAFADAGLCSAAAKRGQHALPSAAAIEKSAIKEHLLAAVDDWADVAAVLGKRDLARDLRNLASQVDPHPWREQIRAAVSAQNTSEFIRLADKALADESVFDSLSPQMLHAVGRLLKSIDAAGKPSSSKISERGRAYAWMSAAQMRHPSDFWLNFDLANIAQQFDRAEAVGYFRTALAVRKQSGAAWNNFGNALRRQKNLTAAIRAFNNAVANEPNNGVAWSNLGMARYDIGDLAGALNACNTAVEREPQNASAWNNLGVILAAKKENAAAMAAYDKAVAINPVLVKALNNKANILRELGRLDAAEALARKAIAINRDYARAWNGLGNTLEKKKEFKEAAAAHETAIELESGNANFWFNLGNARRKDGNHAGAIDAYHEAVKLDKDHIGAWTNLGVSYRNRNEHAAAIDAYQKALAIDRNHVNAWVNLGRVYYAQKKFRDAANAYEKALAIDARNAGAWHNLGVLRYERNNPSGAIAAWRKAVECDVKNASQWRRLGAALRENKDADGAIFALGKAISIEPEDASAHAALGRCYADLHDHVKAVAAYRNAIQRNDHNTYSWYFLGVSLRQLNDLEEAAKAYLKSIALKNDFPNPHLSLALVRRDQGRFAEALKAINKGMELTPLLDRILVYPQLHECQELIKLEKRLPLVRAGKKTDAKEQLALADLCYRYKKMPGEAVALYTNAFAGDPTLADKFASGNRTNAASAAVLSAGIVVDAPAQHRLRQQALAWLRADLKQAGELVDAGADNAGKAVQNRLVQWQSSTELDSVRTAAALAKLSDLEKSTWTAFWQDVGKLQQKLAAAP